MRNKQQVISKFYTLIKWALRKDKKRVPTKPTKAAVRRRLETKQKHSKDYVKFKILFTFDFVKLNMESMHYFKNNLWNI